MPLTKEFLSPWQGCQNKIKPPAILLADLYGDKDTELAVVYKHQGKNFYFQ
jgi:hypothetical protein